MPTNKRYLEKWSRDENVIENFDDLPQEVVDEINTSDYEVDWSHYFTENFEMEKMRSFKLYYNKTHGDYGEKTVIRPEDDFKSEIIMAETTSTYVVRGAVDENDFYPIAVIEHVGVHIPQEETTE